MYRLTLLILLFSTTANLVCAEKLEHATGFSLNANDWPWWRGPTRDGIASAGQNPPTEWNHETNVVWKSPIKGRGHASPIVVGKHIYLPTADEQQQKQFVVCLDRKTGKQVWETQIHEGGFSDKGHKRSSHAGASLASDGERIFANFRNQNAIYTTALSLDGAQLWQTKVDDFVTHQGYAASPAPYGPLVIVSADHKGGGSIKGISRTSGDIAWSHDRPARANYTSPIILPIGGHDQLLLSGCDLITSLAPLTGKPLWEVEGSTTECVTSIVSDGKHIYTSGGYPTNHMSAVRADQNGKEAWRNNLRVYVPSKIVHAGYLYAVTDAGVAMCFDCETGKQQWKGRLGGTFNASLVLSGDNLYAVNEAGEGFVFKADPASFQRIAENKLGDEVFATPVVCDSTLYMRVAENSGDNRQEFLYCIRDR